MKDVVKKVLTDKKARSATVLSSVLLATVAVGAFTPWECC